MQRKQADDNRLIVMLGEAVARAWGSLPRDTQELLFEEALTGRSDGPNQDLREQLALLLHERHPRTASS